MIIFTIYQIFKFALQGFWRNFWLSVVTISVIVLSFISINFLIIINKISESALELVEKKVDISIYMKTDTTKEMLDETENELKSISQVESVKYITESEALEAFRQRHRDDPVILESLEELDSNPLGATFIIRAKNIDDYDDIIQIIDNSQFSSSIKDRDYEDNKIIIQKINSFSRNVNRFGIGVTSIFIVISLLIVFNTIKLAIYTHQKEIAIMKLVGASDSFISFPYIIESIIYAVIACAVSIFLLYPIISFIHPYILTFFKGFENEIIHLPKYFRENFIYFFGLELIGMIILNIIASSLAVRRYLKV